MANNLLKKNDLLGKKQKNKEGKEKIDKRIAIPVIGISAALIVGGIFFISNSLKSDNTKPNDVTIAESNVNVVGETANSNIETVDLSDITKSTIEVSIETDKGTLTNHIVVEHQSKDNKIVDFIQGTNNGVDYRYMYVSDTNSSTWYTYNNGDYEVYEGDVIQNTINVPSIFNNILEYGEDNKASSQLFYELLPSEYTYYTFNIPYKLDSTDNGYLLTMSASDIDATNIGDTGDSSIKIKNIDIKVNIENIADLTENIPVTEEK